MSPRRNGDDRPLLLSIAGLISLPILAGLAAGVIGALGAGVVIAFSGLNGGGASGAPVQASLYMPSYVPTTPTGSPMKVAATVTLTRQPKQAPTTAAPTGPTATPPAGAKIVLVGPAGTVPAGRGIDLSGSYALGTGDTLKVQYLQGKKWKNFSGSLTVVAGTFSTTVSTSKTGQILIRVYDTGNGLTSNVVSVTIA